LIKTGATRRYTVLVSDAEAARLRAFDTKALGRKHWPIGPNTSFMRKNTTTFVVRDWTTMGVGKAYATTVATATVGPDRRVDVVIKSRARSLGYLLIAIGVMCVALTARDGIGALALGLVFLGFGWYWSFSRSWRTADLDAVESVMRREITGDWRPATR
jgi:hypothetical protein